MGPQSRTPSLKKLAKQLLGMDIQAGEHDSVSVPIPLTPLLLPLPTNPPQNPVLVRSGAVYMYSAQYCVVGGHMGWVWYGQAVLIY